MKDARVYMVMFTVFLFGGAFALYLDLGSLHYRYFAIVVASSGVFALIAWLVVKYAAQWRNRFVYALLASGVLLRIIAIGTGPVASDDMYRYIWDGMVQSEGINPYRYAPDDREAAFPGTDELRADINFPEMKTVYPPLAEWIFWGSYLFAGQSEVLFKLPLLAAEILTILLLVFLLRRMDLPAGYALFYALCPLTVYQFMVDGHLDALSFPFVLLFLWYWSGNKKARSMVAAGAAALIKLLPLIFLPLVAREAWKKKALLVLAIVPLMLIAAYLPYILGAGSPFESLQTYSTSWEFNGSLYQIIRWATDSGAAARVLVFVLLAAWVARLAVSERPIEVRMYLAVFGFLLLAPTVHPWYIAWLAVLLPFHIRWSGIAFIVLSSLSNISGVVYHGGGVWHEPAWLAFVQYVPVYALLAWEAAQKRATLSSARPA